MFTKGWSRDKDNYCLDLHMVKERTMIMVDALIVKIIKVESGGLCFLPRLHPMTLVLKKKHHLMNKSPCVPFPKMRSLHDKAFFDYVQRKGR